MAKTKKLFSTNKKAETVKESAIQNSQQTFEQVMSQILGKPVKILELNTSGVTGMEDPTWKYIQFVTLNVNGTYSRFELGVIENKVFFDFMDPVFEDPSLAVPSGI